MTKKNLTILKQNNYDNKRKCKRIIAYHQGI